VDVRPTIGRHLGQTVVESFTDLLAGTTGAIDLSAIGITTDPLRAGPAVAARLTNYI
jgi:hypothetical protein